MNLLKLAFTTPLTLVLLNYSKETDEIILTIDTSLEEWEGVLIQLI